MSEIKKCRADLLDCKKNSHKIWQLDKGVLRTKFQMTGDNGIFVWRRLTGKMHLHFSA